MVCTPFNHEDTEETLHRLAAQGIILLNDHLEIRDDTWLFIVVQPTVCT